MVIHGLYKQAVMLELLTRVLNLSVNAHFHLLTGQTFKITISSQVLFWMTIYFFVDSTLHYILCEKCCIMID